MKQLIISLLSLILVAGAVAKERGTRSPTHAAGFKSGIAGRLTDPNGAVIAGATIRIIAQRTKKLVSLKTDDKGEYITDLDPDVYDVEADAAGFKKARRKSIPVLLEARSYVDFVLEPGPNDFRASISAAERVVEPGITSDSFRNKSATRDSSWIPRRDTTLRRSSPRRPSRTLWQPQMCGKT
jgi:hypothetical protein